MKQKYLQMGVINITPNSFSDGGEFNLYSNFARHFSELLNWAQVIDIGAESTAPFNDPIDSIEELERFEAILLPYIAHNKDPEIILSIDTYKPEVFYEVALWVNLYWPKTKLWFNDVSGCIDSELELLFKSKIKFDYVFCHNNCPSRDKTSYHMDYISDVKIKKQIKRSLKYAEKLTKSGRKVYFDPCFGFSKTREQNQKLLKKLPHLMQKMDEFDGVLIGISRKSFLREPKNMNAKDPANQLLLDQIQSIVFSRLVDKDNKKPLIFRVHSPTSLKSALKFKSLFA